MTSMELFVTELLEEAAPAIIAMNSVLNFEELEAKAEEIATADYMKNKDTATFASMYSFIMERYLINEKELIKDMLSYVSLHQIAKEINSPELIAYAESSLLTFCGWFEAKENADEAAAYNFFKKQLG